MKSLKKNVTPSEVQPTATINDLFQRILKNAGHGGERLFHSKAQAHDIFLIRTEDIPADELPRLIDSQKGITINPGDNLLHRLLKLEKENRQLKSLSMTDGLTSLHNKRFFNRQMKIEITRTRRTGQPFCLIFIDLDNFKTLNDTLGHTKGDEFLLKMSRLICQKIRPTDLACRYGGDEFTIIMPATSLMDGISIAQRWHDLICKVSEQMGVDVSASIGVDEYDVLCTLDAEEFTDKVDRELYAAKKSGKNKVCYPGFLQVPTAQERSVTPEEKDALYKTSSSATKKTARKGKN